jgi:glycosyltransferase involved in cell wall biosynthesis
MTAESDRPRILFLAHLLPWPLDGGGQIKSFHTLRILASAYDITLLSFVRRPEDAESLEALTPQCTGGVHTVRLPRGKIRDARAALVSFVRRESFLMTRDDYATMQARICALLAEAEVSGRPFRAIHVDHLQMISFVPRDTRSAVVLDNHNVEYRIPKRLSETPGASSLMRWFMRIEWPKLRAFERAACRRADRVLAVSDEDAAELTALDPAEIGSKVGVTPIGVDLEYWGSVRPNSAATGILSIGTMFWPPNVDAILYFCAEILPLIRASIPGARLTVVGARPTAAIRALSTADPAITVTGWVEDVRPFAESEGGVFVVPLRSGSGMRVKILNAMAMGLPVVSTTVGAEGIDVTAGENILLADTPAAFAHAVVGLMQDRGRAAEIGDAGRKLVEQSYGWDAVGRKLFAEYRLLFGETETLE